MPACPDTRGRSLEEHMTSATVFRLQGGGPGECHRLWYWAKQGGDAGEGDEGGQDLGKGLLLHHLKPIAPSPLSHPGKELESNGLDEPQIGKGLLRAPHVLL